MYLNTHLKLEKITFATAERLWRKRYPDRTPHLQNIFSHLAKQIKIKGLVQLQHNKATQIRRPIRDDRTTEILASTELNPYDSLRRRERDSVNRDIV